MGTTLIYGTLSLLALLAVAFVFAKYYAKSKVNEALLREELNDLDDKDGSIEQIPLESIDSRKGKRKARRFNRKSDRIQDKLNRKRRWIKKNS